MGTNLHESPTTNLRTALPDPGNLHGTPTKIWEWLSVHAGKFSMGTIAGCAGVNINNTAFALGWLIGRDLVRVINWNDEKFDPLYTADPIPVEAIPTTEPELGPDDTKPIPGMYRRSA